MKGIDPYRGLYKTACRLIVDTDRRGYGYAITPLSLRDISPIRGIPSVPTSVLGGLSVNRYEQTYTDIIGAKRPFILHFALCILHLSEAN